MTALELEKIVESLESKSISSSKQLDTEMKIDYYNQGFIDGRLFVYRTILDNMKKAGIEIK